MNIRRELEWKRLMGDLDEIREKRARREAQAKGRLKKRLYGIEALGGRCMVCGVRYPVEEQFLYDFHHLDLDGRDLEAPMPQLSWKKFKAELEKCALLCCVCHRRAHWSLDL
jgi:hypothetical protein